MSKRAEMIRKRTQTHRDAAARAMDGFVRTPAALADDLVSGHRDMGAFPPGARVLEPSAGDGAIVRAILENDADVHVVAVEPNGERADALDALDVEYPGRVTVYRGTFEQFTDYIESCRAPGMSDADQVAMGEPFDAVIMNPPFGDSTRDLVWMGHVRGAWDLLRPGAVLVSIVPPSYEFRSDRKHRDFRTWAESNGATFDKLPGQPFKESGTGTSAGVLTVRTPMPARPDGLPLWLHNPAAGVPVAVPGYPHVTASGALTMPVQEYDDRSGGSRPRVIRYAGTCYGCARIVWDHDDRHDANVWEASTIDAADTGHAGPSVAMCLECYTSNADAHTAALRDVAAYWTDVADADPTADDGPVVYPMDLCAGLWATVNGVDYRGWTFTMTGRVMADPEPVGDLGGDVSFPRERIAVKLRTARGVDVELYPRSDSRVTVRDVPIDVVLEPHNGPIPPGMPEPAAGGYVMSAPIVPAGKPGTTARVGKLAGKVAEGSNGGAVIGVAGSGQPVIVAHVTRVDVEPAAPVADVVEPAAVLNEPLSSDYGRMGATRVPFRIQPVTVVGDVAFEPGMIRVRLSDGTVRRTLREYVTLTDPAPAAPVADVEPAADPVAPVEPDNGSTVVKSATDGRPVIVAHVSRVDITDPAPDAEPFLSGWGDLADA
jgi:hypothetical protein